MEEKLYLFAPKYYAKRMLLTAEELVGMDLNKKEGHASPYYYDTMQEYFTKNVQDDGSEKKIDSEAGYRRNVMADWWYADFDKKDDPEGCALAILPLLQYLKRENIYHIFFFSSSKGFHLYIPKGYIDYDEELDNHINVVFKRFSKQLEKQFPSLKEVLDDQVYSPVHLLRMPFSYRNKSEMRKSLLSLKDDIDTTKHFTEWFEMEPYSKPLAITIKEFLFNPYTVEEPHWKLEEIATPIITGRKKRSLVKFDTPYKEKVCIYKILSNSNPPAGRHVTMLRLIAFFYEKGYPEEMIYQHISYWNSTLDSPMNDSEVAHNMKTIGKYSYTCHDEIKFANCTLDNTCSYWEGAVHAKGISDSTTAIQNLVRYESEDTKYHLQFDTLWENFIYEVRPSGGHITVFYAESGLKILLANLKGKTYLYTQINLTRRTA